MSHVKRNKSTQSGEDFHLINGFRLPGRSPSKSGVGTSAHTNLDNRGISEQKNSKRQQKSYSQRLETKHKSKLKLANLLLNAGEKSLSDRLKLCASAFTAITCGRHVVQRIPNHNCDFRLCPFCAARRSKKIVRKYLPRAESFLKVPGLRVQPVHLVLTQGKRKGESVRDARKRLLDSFKRLKKRQFWGRYFAGGLYAVEFTTGTDRKTHCHLHILAFRRRFFDVSILRAEWKTATNGEGLNVFSRPVENIASGLREVVKYVSKPLDIDKLDARRIKEFLEMRNARMFGAFGEFAKFCRGYEEGATDNENESEKGGFCEGDACPICAAPLFEIQTTTENLIAFSRRAEMVPRRLTNSRKL